MRPACSIRTALPWSFTRSRTTTARTRRVTRAAASPAASSRAELRGAGSRRGPTRSGPLGFAPGREVAGQNGPAVARPVRRAVDPLRQCADEGQAEPRRPRRVRCLLLRRLLFRRLEPDPVVGELHPGASRFERVEHHRDGALAARKGVLEAVDDELVDDQAQRHGTVDFDEERLDRGFDTDIPAGETVEVHQIAAERSEEPTSEIQTLMRKSYADLCLKT